MGDLVRAKLRTQDLTWRELESELIVLDLRTSRYFAVNRSGMVLWRRLADGATMEDLTTDLVDAFDIPEEQAEADVASFLEFCRQRGLIEIEDRP